MPDHTIHGTSRLFIEDGQIFLKVSADHAISADWLQANTPDLYRLWLTAGPSDRDAHARLIDQRFASIEDGPTQRDAATDLDEQVHADTPSDQNLSPDTVTGIFMAAGTQYVFLERAHTGFSTDWLGSHAPRLYEQWRTHDDVGVRQEIADRVESIMIDLNHADRLDNHAGPPTTAELEPLRQEWRDLLVDADAVTDAERRHVERAAANAPHLKAWADDLRDIAENADIPLTIDELTSYRSGQTTLQWAMSEANFRVPTGCHPVTGPGGRTQSETVYTDQLLRATLDELAGTVPHSEVDADIMQHIHEVISEVLHTRVQTRAAAPPTQGRTEPASELDARHRVGDKKPEVVPAASQSTGRSARTLARRVFRVRHDVSGAVLPPRPPQPPPSMAPRPATGPRR